MEEKEIEELEEYGFIRYWNFRWFKIEIEVPECNDFGPTGKIITEHYYELHEVHYDRNNKPCMWTENCTDFQITNAEELIDLMIKCLDATDKKVLLLKNDKLIEIDEYMDKKETIEQFRKGKNNMVENTYSIQNLLDYKDIAEIQNNPKFRHKLIKNEFRKLTNKIIEEHIKPETIDVDIAYRFQFKVIDDMNIVGKITSIPVMDVILKQPVIENQEFVYNQPRKFNLKERLQILFTGRV